MPPVGGNVSRSADTSAGDATPSDVPDVLAPGLRVVFVGINPGRVSAAAHAHFANPRNDFWRLLYAAHFTSRLYSPDEQFELLDEEIGVTNAAYRTTPGSGDLRRGDFDGAAERLARIADELRPGWLGFVGKEAYRGTFNERPELGLQERTLGDTRLFVLPSTSPANAAVPWWDRLRWFMELAARAYGQPPRTGVRALVLDTSDNVLMIRFSDEFGDWWSTPGGGVDPGESDRDALDARARGGGRAPRLRARPADLDAGALARQPAPLGRPARAPLSRPHRAVRADAGLHRSRAEGRRRHRRPLVHRRRAGRR